MILPAEGIAHVGVPALQRHAGKARIESLDEFHMRAFMGQRVETILPEFVRLVLDRPNDATAQDDVSLYDTIPHDRGRHGDADAVVFRARKPLQRIDAAVERGEGLVVVVGDGHAVKPGQVDIAADGADVGAKQVTERARRPLKATRQRLPLSDTRSRFSRRPLPSAVRPTGAASSTCRRSAVRGDSPRPLLRVRCGSRAWRDSPNRHRPCRPP